MANYYNSVLSSKRIREQCLVLEYENLAQNAQGLFDALVFDFLNVSPIHVSSQLRKQNPGELSESVENYDEVRELLERKLQLKTEANRAL